MPPVGLPLPGPGLTVPAFPMRFSAFRFPRVLLAAASCLLVASALSAAPGSARRPNIIVILADDLGYGDIGPFFQAARHAAGKPAILTPELDRIAASGARLTAHACAAPVCAPSRASLLSGLHQGHANVRNNQFDKALADNHTVATVLKEAGYATAAFGKWGLQGRAEGGAPNWPAHPLNRGFDFYFGYIRHADGHEHYPKEAPYRNRDFNAKKKGKAATTGEEADDANPKLHGKEVWDNRTEISRSLDRCYTTDLFAARAKKWIVDQKQAQPDQPFFAYLAFDTPHATIELPPVAYPAGGGLKGGLQWLGKPGHMINTAEGVVDGWMHPDYANASYDHDGNPATPEQPWPDVYRRYATSVRRIDDAVADLMTLLKDLGVERDTLVVFTSDNGPSLESYLAEQFSPEFFRGFGPFDGVKRDLWEGGVRVPTLAFWPGRIRAGLTVDAPNAHWDWLPTFAEAAGLPAPANADGVSLLPALTNGATPDRAHAPLYFEYRHDGRTPPYEAFEPSRRDRQRREMQSLRLGNIVGIRYDVKSAEDDFEFYDVVADPKQTRNLAATAGFSERQREFKDAVLRMRRPDASAPRPYDAAPIPAVTPPPTAPGLAWQRFDRAFPWVPSTASLRADAQGITPALTLEPVGGKGAFAAQFTGYVRVPAEGEYTFTVQADTGVVVRLHDATLHDVDFHAAPNSSGTATVRLKAGLHPVRITYRHAAERPATLAMRWSGPGISEQPMPANAFVH